MHSMPPADFSSSQSHGILNNAPRLFTSPNPPLELSWFYAVILASSFGGTADIERAEKYWKRAEDLAASPMEGLAARRKVRANPSAQIYTLRAMGQFYYYLSDNTRNDSNLKLARDTFEKSLKILKPELDGASVTYGLNSQTLLIWAQQEDLLGNTEKAAQRMREAWKLSRNIPNLGGRQQAKLQIADFIAFGMCYESDPSRFDRYGALPQDLADEVSKLLSKTESSSPAA